METEYTALEKVQVLAEVLKGLGGPAGVTKVEFDLRERIISKIDSLLEDL